MPDRRFAAFQAKEIQLGKSHCAFEFVGMIGMQKHHRTMGLDTFHRMVGCAVTGRPGNKGNHLILQVVHSRLHAVCGRFGRVKKGSPAR